MLSYIDISLFDLYCDPCRECTIIVPITDLGFIQDNSIRQLSIIYPDILRSVQSYSEGRNNGLISYYVDNALSSRLVFISCINTKRGICELDQVCYLAKIENILATCGRTLDKPITTYLIEPIVSTCSVFNETIEEIMEISFTYGVGLNYIVPSLIL